jgi:hypothetical protein
MMAAIKPSKFISLTREQFHACVMTAVAKKVGERKSREWEMTQGGALAAIARTDRERGYYADPSDVRPVVLLVLDEIELD